MLNYAAVLFAKCFLALFLSDTRKEFFVRVVEVFILILGSTACLCILYITTSESLDIYQVLQKRSSIQSYDSTRFTSIL